jgi:threonine dehydrogenase-like Zn-dependent dehydrogenase
MKALVLQGYGTLEHRDVPEPEIGADEALVHIKACGICGSDVHGMDGSTGRRIPPIIMGHEASGVISRLGENVSGWSVGERVTFDSTISCGDCWHCRRGEINLCDTRRVLGVSCDEYRRDGAFAEYVAVPQRILYRIPAGVEFIHAAMAEPLSVAVHAVRLAGPDIGETAVVVGAGMIGLLLVQCLRASGCGTIIAVDLDEAKLGRARELGADLAVDPKSPGFSDEILSRTEGRGADCAFEAVGVSSAIQTAAGAVRKGGRLVLVGNIAPRVELPLQTIVTREIALFGSCASQGEYPACLSLIANGRINLASLISARAPLADGAQWFDRLHRQEPTLLKVILEP